MTTAKLVPTQLVVGLANRDHGRCSAHRLLWRDIHLDHRLAQVQRTIPDGTGASGRKNPQVIEQLGKPVEESGWVPSGNFSYHINNGVASGEATFDFSVAGPKDTAHVHAQARCRDGKWRFLQLQVTPTSTGTVMSLPVDEKPGRAENEPELD